MQKKIQEASPQAAEKLGDHTSVQADKIEVIPLVEKVVDDTESLMSKTSFNGAFTERER